MSSTAVPAPTTGARTYPDPITPDMLAKWARCTDEQISTDLRDTEREIIEVDELNRLEREAVQSPHVADFSKRIRWMQIDAREATNRDRVRFCAFLRRLQAARAAAAVKVGP